MLRFCRNFRCSSTVTTAATSVASSSASFNESVTNNSNDNNNNTIATPQPIAKYHPLLMKFAAKVEVISTITSITYPNEAAFAHSSQLSHWSSKLRQSFLTCLRASPTKQSISKFSHKLLEAQQDHCGQSQLSGSSSSSSSSSSSNRSNSDSSCNIHEAMLLLSLCYQTGTTPSASLLAKCEQFAPQLMSACYGTCQYLLLVLSCFEFYAPHRIPTILTRVQPHVEASAQSLRSSELFVLFCAFSNAQLQFPSFSSSSASSHNIESTSTSSLFPPSLFDCMLERALMVSNEFSSHQVSQLSCCCVSTIPTSSSSTSSNETNSSNNNNNNNTNNIKDALIHDFAPRFLQLQELSTLNDAATILHSCVVAGIDDHRELNEACARRIYLMLRDMDAENFTKILCGLSRINLKTPRLLADLSEIAGRMKFDGLSPFAALDAASAAASLGIVEDALFSRLTQRLLANRNEILRNEQAREKLLALATLIQ